MTNSAAFLTSTFSTTSQPSIFEVTAQQSLAQTLGPACRHIFKVAATQQPELFGFLLQVQDELLLLANAALQLHYLKVYNASFTENFYGLERVSKSREKLMISPSFLCLVVAPYIRRKLETLFQKCREDEADSVRPSNPVIARMRSIFLSVYPSLHFIAEVVDIGFLLSFSLKKSRFHNLLSWLVGVYLIYVTQDRQKEKESRKMHVIQESHGLTHLAITSVSTTARILTFSLEVGSFFLQFLDWWYTQGGPTAGDRDTQDIPRPPPIITDPGVKGGTCPLCYKKRRGDTVLPASGLVFCYTCIVHNLRREARCPITKLPAKEEQLIRIFTQQ